MSAAVDSPREGSIFLVGKLLFVAFLLAGCSENVPSNDEFATTGSPDGPGVVADTHGAGTSGSDSDAKANGGTGTGRTTTRGAATRDATATRAKPPNVVFILADDIGRGDIASYYEHLSGNDAVTPTPNLDRLASEGMMFVDAHSPAPVCAPARYSALTGNYPYRGRLPEGVWGAFAQTNIQEGQQTIAETMRQAGYRTSFFGKWHIGARWYDFDGNPAYAGYEDRTVDLSRGMHSEGPTDQGFDYSFSLPAGIQARPYMAFENDQPFKLKEDSEIVQWALGTNGKLRNDGKGDSNWDSRGIGRLLAEKAVSFIDDHMIHHGGKPFLLYFASQAVHIPHTPPVDFNGTPVKGQTASAHTDMVFELDLQVGAILTKLEAEGILDDTVIIFTSDNGGLRRRVSEDHGHFSSFGVRGYKSNIWEGGHTVPFIVRWSGVVEPGSISEQRISLIDWVGTMYDMLGLPMQEGQALDTVSLVPVLAGVQDAAEPIRESSLVTGRFEPMQSLIVRDDWALIYIDGQPSELYNLATDPLQEINLLAAPGYQARITELDALHRAAQTSSRSTPVVDYSDPGNKTPLPRDAVTPPTGFAAGESGGGSLPEGRLGVDGEKTVGAKRASRSVAVP